MPRRPAFLVAAILWMAAFVFPAGARADEFADFRIPKSRAFGWRMDFRSDAAQSIQASGRNGNWSGQLGSDAFWLADSDPSRTEVSLFVGVSGNRSSATDHASGFSVSDPRRDLRVKNRSVSESMGIALMQRRYPNRAPIGIEVSFGASGGLTQYWASQESEEWLDGDSTAISHQRREFDVTRHTYGRSLSLGITVGLGRVRNVTAVYEERVFEDRLQKTGALVRPLSIGAREKLTALLFLGDAFSRVHDRPAKFLWEEIERVLREDGALRDDRLDPYSLFRTIEPFVGSGVLDDGGPRIQPRSPVLRQRGFFVGPFLSVAHFLGGEHARNRRRDEYDVGDTTFVLDDVSSRNFSSGDDRATGGVRSEVHWPLGPRWQIDGDARVRTNLRKPESERSGSSFAAIRSIVADRWTAGVSVSYSRLMREQPGARPRSYWAAGLGGDLTFFVEDHLQLQFAASQSQSRIDGSYRRELRATVGVGYRFLGGFDIPGVIRPVRVPGESE